MQERLREIIKSKNKKFYDNKYLIIHMDDIGMSYAANEAAARLYQKGIATSGSIMMPCPWAVDFIKWHRHNSQFDIGIHLTLTCEWNSCRWRPLSSSEQVNKLLDEEGFMHKGFEQEIKEAPLEQVAIEVQSQIDLAKRWGLRFTHLDTHMFSLFFNDEHLLYLFKTARENNVAFHIPKSSIWNEYRLQLAETFDFPIVENAVSSGDGSDYRAKKRSLLENVSKLDKGLNVLTIHPVIDTHEIRQIIPDWEQRYLEYLLFMDDEVKEHIQKCGIKLISWEEAQKHYENHF